MPLREKVPTPGDRDAICAFALRWTIDQELADRIIVMQTMFPHPLQIISGYRTREEQAELERQGRPAALDHLSTHRSCPATGADLWPLGVTIVPAVKAAFGDAAMRARLRWGGGSRPDERGIPSDWNHVDLGPRRS